ncbi:DUF4118 domain-containing protein, partial [Pseudorhodoplanes sp.]|uniref:DUF4118 domain-containing protein n=1 Tax=Pseudorhodoplanes sp. TaxID=1934341 RepID=UPI003D0A903C
MNVKSVLSTVGKKSVINGSIPKAVMRYAIPVLAVAVVSLIRVLFWEVLGHDYEYLLFWPVVILATAYGGFGPGVWATFLCALVVMVLFSWPLTKLGPGTLVGFLVFIAVGTLCSFLI